MAGWESRFILITLFTYFIAGGLAIMRSFWNNRIINRATVISAAAGLLANSGAIIVRTWQAGHLPLTNMYEFGLAFVWGLMVVQLYIELRYRVTGPGTVALPGAFLLIMLFTAFYQEVRPLVPALKSNWLLAHVITAVIAYGALTASFAVAVAYLLRLGSNTPAQREFLDQLANKLINFALPFLTLLILTGAVWAEYAWGSYWRWDPKETWSLITWIIYAVYLHGRLVFGWRGVKAMKWVIAGFAAVIFTFIGVNLLMPGLHSYAF